MPEALTESAPDTEVVPADGPDPQTPPKTNREARYRVERNQAREALTAAESRITQYQTREVERLASELAQPSDLFGVGGVSLADLVGEDGEVDAELVEEAVASLLEQRPGLAKDYRPVRGATDPSQGLGGAGRPPQLDWNDLLKRGEPSSGWWNAPSQV